MIESFSFSTQGLTPPEAAETYRNLYDGGADVVSSGQAVSAEVTAHRLDRLILFDRRLTGVGHARPAQRVGLNGFSHFVVHLVVEGVLVGSEVSGFEQARPGDLVLQDLRRQTRTTIPDGRLITVSVARDLIEAAAGAANGLHGRVLDPDQAGLLGDYLLSLCRRAGALEHDALPTVSRTFVDLLGLAIGPTGGGATASKRRMEFDRREAIQRIIEQGLGDPGLNAGVIARETGVSRATLYRLLAPHGGVDSFIQSRRLAAVRTTLDRSDDTTPLAELALRYAFRNEADMRSRFRARFGLSPAAYRQMVDDPTRRLETIKRRWASWMVEVR
ncbi:helix-turn-helix domain-containing protein [Brevundimonas mediterranea]|uniref:Transcriptional activator NphR n=1 Tax=Brevundimonas mediterranea TaxID=74329 RepID=A0A7Z9C6M0_9CAUL|nr:helix-turn-helix domain-containing protein [Brevundimonas mediterranea]VDC51167.1 Transcriptional activator NphR [Brevundimonas mediterranea]